MCSSPSHPQQVQTSSQDQPHDSPQALDPINPVTQPDPDTQIADPDPRGDDPEEDQDDLDQDPDYTDSDFPLPPHTGMMSPSISKKPSFSKRKKVSAKKQQAIEKKRQTLLENLKPVPFYPSKIPDFTKHEKLLKRLGLWDFFHVEFDRNVRVDLIAQLIATYDPKLRASYVNDFRIAVNRADLGRAFGLHVKKEKGGNADGVDMDVEPLTEESIAFLECFVSNWLLLHEDTWMMPNEVLNWNNAIKEGHPEKVDWASLFWFMVEKELLKGEQLVECYYASHLQYLIKNQREEAMVIQPTELCLRADQNRIDLDADEDEVEVFEEKKEEDEKKVVDLNAEKVVSMDVDGGNSDAAAAKEEKGSDDVIVGGVSDVLGNDVIGGLNIELTLGSEIGDDEEGKAAEEKEEGDDAPVMDVEEGVGDEVQLKQPQWLLDGKNNSSGHFLQRCSMGESAGFDSFEESKEGVDEFDVNEEDMEEDGGNRFDTLGGDGLTGNFLQAMETNHNHLAFVTQAHHLHDDSSMDLVDHRNDLHHATSPGLSFYNDNGKRVVDSEHDMMHSSLNGNNKRLRIDASTDPKSLDFGMCVGQVEQMMSRARMLYAEKEQAVEQSNLNQQVLLDELQKRGSMIEHMQKAHFEELQKKDAEMYRLQRELYLMGSVLDDYRKAIKQTNKEFAEYRQKCQLPEEPIYHVAGPGGLVLSTSDLEKRRLKEEEEYKLKFTILEEAFKEAEESYAVEFGKFLDSVNVQDKRLSDLEKTLGGLRELKLKPKASENQQQVEEAPEGPTNEEAPEGPTNEEAPEGPTNEEAPEGPTNEEAPEGPTNEEAPEGLTNA